MSSLYLRKDSPYIWIHRLNLKTGAWVNQSTHQKPGKHGTNRHAQKLKDSADIDEGLYRRKKHSSSISPVKQRFENWVVAYMDTRFGYSREKTGGTLYRYSHWWKPIMRYLAENKIDYPTS
jgi:hypothetical protein